MRRGIWILLLACVSLMNVACQNGVKKNNPETVAEQFAKAFYTADFTHLYQYTTKKSDIVIKHLQSGMKNETERLEEMRNIKVEFVETKLLEQTDSTATCSCSVKLNGRPRTDNWDLLKEDDEWKVTLVMP